MYSRRVYKCRSPIIVPLRYNIEIVGSVYIGWVIIVANKAKQKLKLLYIYQILQEESDSEHGIDAPHIVSKLAEKGISAERKSIYSDIGVLREFGLTIGEVSSGQRGYYLKRSGLDISELMLLIDTVQSCKFLDKKTADRLTRHIKELASANERDELKGRVHVDGRIKSQSESVFHNVDMLHKAMGVRAKDRKKISFQYQRFDNHLEKQVIHDGTEYVLTPVQVVLAEGFYYLIAWSDEHEDFRHFRIDRMRLLQESKEPVTRDSRIATFKYEDYALKMFGMFGGKEKSVRLRAQADAIDIIADRFGWDDAIKTRTKALGDGSMELSIPVVISPQFFGWIAGLNGKVTIVGPKGVLEEYRSWLKGLASEV